MRQWWPWAVIAVLFVTFCSIYNQKTPYLTPGVLMHQRAPEGGHAKVPDVGAPDERQHVHYVDHLLSGEGVPTFNPNDPNLYESYQFHQPPLYYLIAAGWSKVVGYEPDRGDTTSPAPNLGFMLRLLNTLIGLATLVALGLGAWWGFGSRALALCAPAFMLLPMNVALHSAVSNDPLLFCLCSWVLALTGLAMREGWTTKRCLLVGALTGFAFLTKTTSIGLVPVLCLAFFLSSKSGKEESLLRPFVTVAGMSLAMGLFWWIRNMSLYGDPFAMSAFNQAFVGSPQASVFIDSFGAQTYWLNMVLWWTARSFIGAFGYMDIFMFESLGMAKSDQINASLTLVFCLIALVSLAGTGRLKVDKLGRSFAIVSAFFGLVVTVLFISFNKKYFQGQARYLYPAIAPISWLLGAGFCVLTMRASKWAWAAATVFLCALNLVAINEITTGFPLRFQ